MAAESNLDVHVRGHDELTPELNKAASSLIRWTGAISAALGAVRAGLYPVDAIRSFQREMANVQKTTGYSDQQIRQLSRSITQMSLQVDIGATDLAKIAAAAGQQGLGGEGVAGIAQFTDSVSRMASVLDVTVDDAGAAIGKLSTIFKTPLADIESMVSGFNEVANNSTATGEQLLDVVRRLGDAAGTLNLSQSLGISAAAIDFGVSPEVAGTSLNKIFADMQSKADKFATLMNSSAQAMFHTTSKEWVDLVQKDGIEAFKIYLARLRELDGESRQVAIRELSGTGRIGSLLNKFVNDSMNGLLDRNIGSAGRGIDSGTSALREQETVLKTLDAQIKITGNAFQNLAIQAGEQFAGQLASYMNELGRWLSDPKVVASAEALGQSMLAMFSSIRDGIVWVASLNINWENFYKVAQAFLTLKLVEYLASFSARVLGLNTAMNALTKASKESQAAQAGAAQAGNTGLIAGIRSMKEMLDTRQRYIAALREQKAAEQALSAAQVAANKAGMRNIYEQQGAAIAPQAGRAAVNTARTALQAAQAAAAGVDADQQAIRNGKLQAAQQVHVASLLRIEQEYETRRLAAKASGNAKEAAAAREWRAAEEAAENQRNERSIRSLEAHHTRRIAEARRAAVAEVAARQQALDAALNAYGNDALNGGTAKARAGARTAAAEQERLNALVVEQQDRLSRATGEVEKASGAYQRLGTALRFVGTAFSVFLAAASKLLIWGTIIYTILDMTIGVDKLASGFQKLTDALGFTSAAQRARAQLDADEKRNLEEKKKALDDVIARYREYTDLSTGRLRSADIAALPGLLTGDNQAASKKAVEDVTTQLQGIFAEAQRSLEGTSIIPDQLTAVRRQLTDVEIEYNRAAERLKNAQAARAMAATPTLSGGPNPVAEMLADRGVARAEKEMADLEVVMKDLRKKADDMSRALGSDGLAASAEIAGKNFEDLRGVVAGLFTPQSAELFQQFAQRFIDTRKNSKEALDALREFRGTAVNVATMTDKEKADWKAREQELIGLQAAADALQKDTMKEFADQLKRLAETPGMKPEVINALYAVREFLGLEPARIEAMQKALENLSKTGTALTGANVPKASPASPGTQNVDPNEEKEATKIARARLALEKAKLQALANLQKVAADEEMKLIEDTNRQNLISLSDYYDGKTRLQQEDYDRSIKLAQLERKAIVEERKNMKKESDRIRADADIARVDGEIAVLRAQRENAPKENAREMREALKQFNDRLVNENLSLSQLLGSPDDQARFDEALQGYEVSYRDFVQRLRTESETRPELLPMIDRIEAAGRLRAVADVFTQITKEARRSEEQLTNYTGVLQSLYQAGSINSGELSAALDRVRARQIEILELERERMTVALLQGEAGTEAYIELEAQLAAVLARLQQLKLEGNSVAREMGDGFRSAFQSAFQDFRPGGSLTSQLRDFALNVVGVMQSTVSKNLAENAMGALDRFANSKTNGKDGVGGAIFSALGMGGGRERGNTRTAPLYVQDVNSPAAGLDNPVDAAAGKLQEASKGIFDKLTNDFLPGLSDTFSGFLDGAGSTFGELFSGLGGMLSNLFSGSGGGGGFLSMFAGLFHSGGRVSTAGRRTGRFVSPGLFANAARYHNGTPYVGLAPGEVPAILKEGETVRTPEQEAALRKRRGEGGEDGKGDINIYIVPQDQVPAQGPDDVVMVVAQNISKNGSIAQLIRKIPR